MSKTDAHLISELLLLADAKHAQLEIRQLAAKVARRYAELIADNEQLLKQGSDHS